jgi:hypothetical protein
MSVPLPLTAAKRLRPIASPDSIPGISKNRLKA